MRTRKSAPSKTAQQQQDSDQTPSQSQSQSQPSKTLTPADRPSKTFILPSSRNDDNARFVQLPNPRTGELTRYYFSPDRGVYEFTVVASPGHHARSILFTNNTAGSGNGKSKSNLPDSPSENESAAGSISKTAELLIATPIDILFFMIPLLTDSGPTKGQHGLFQPLGDIIDSHDELPKHLRHVLYHDSFRESLTARVEAICDSVEAGDEKMFRLSETKLLKELLAKGERMVAQGMPVSLEERFVRQALTKPLMAVDRKEPETTAPKIQPPDGGDSQEKEDTPSASTAATTATSTSTPSGAETPATETTTTPDDSSPPEDVTHLLRLSTALSLLKKSYLSDSLCAKIDSMLDAPESPIDFKPLTEYLKHIADLRSEALASRNLGDFSRKRGLEDDDVGESRAEKKRRLEEDEKKQKAAESKGVKDLRKVNTSGMKKMSDFFGKRS